VVRFYEGTIKMKKIYILAIHLPRISALVGGWLPAKVYAQCIYRSTLSFFFFREYANAYLIYIEGRNIFTRIWSSFYRNPTELRKTKTGDYSPPTTPTPMPTLAALIRLYSSATKAARVNGLCCLLTSPKTQALLVLYARLAPYLLIEGIKSRFSLPEKTYNCL
jgi:hypothetical protein